MVIIFVVKTQNLNISNMTSTRTSYYFFFFLMNDSSFYKFTRSLQLSFYLKSLQLSFKVSNRSKENWKMTFKLIIAAPSFTNKIQGVIFRYGRFCQDLYIQNFLFFEIIKEKNVDKCGCHAPDLNKPGHKLIN